MFVPPPLKPVHLFSAVAPYEADVSQRKLWEMRQLKHREALAQVCKLTDQAEPVTSTDMSLRRARERSRAFAADELHRHIGVENRKLMCQLSEIVQKPSQISKLIDAEHRALIPKRGVEAERKRQREIAYENQMLVKRLLSVRTSFDRKGNEKDFSRHCRDVERMKKISAPLPLHTKQLKPALSSSGLGQLVVPVVHNITRCSRTLPPLPQGLALQASQSLPALSMGSQADGCASDVHRMSPLSLSPCGSMVAATLSGSHVGKADGCEADLHRTSPLSSCGSVVAAAFSGAHVGKAQLPEVGSRHRGSARSITSVESEDVDSSTQDDYEEDSWFDPDSPDMATKPADVNCQSPITMRLPEVGDDERTDVT